MTKNKKLKTIVLSMGLGVAMFVSTPVQAQMVAQRGNDLFYGNSQNEGLMQRGNGLFSGNSQNEGLMQRGGNRSIGMTLGNEGFGAAGSQINNESFGAPLGGGIGILLAAGMGYAFIQSKKNKQN